MSQKAEKFARDLRIRQDKLERDMQDLKVRQMTSDGFWESLQEIDAMYRRETSEKLRDAKHEVREQRRAANYYRNLAIGAGIAAVGFLMTTIITVYAMEPDSAVSPVGVPVIDVHTEQPEEPEDFENEKIEEALLARSSSIEDCTVTFYCAEKYPHICGTGDGIAYDGTPVLPWATCAVDPDVIPLGSTVMMDLGDGEGLRTLVANDTGVTGNHIDLCVPTHTEALQLGRMNATVYWCEE